MKGLLFGMVYGTGAVCITMLFLALVPFRYNVINWSNVPIGCFFWYLVACLGISIIFMLFFLVINSKYKKRQRNEDLPKGHCFAENYYEYDPTESQGHLVRY